MPRTASAQTRRWPTNVTLPADLLAEARALGLNLSEACAQGLKAEIARHQAAAWLRENGAALASANDYVERNGVPLGEFHQF